MTQTRVIIANLEKPKIKWRKPIFVLIPYLKIALELQMTISKDLIYIVNLTKSLNIF